MPDKLTCEVYNKTRLAIRGDRALYNDLVKKIGGRWNSRMHGGEGWIIPIEQREVVEDLINSLNDTSDSKIICKEKEELNEFNTQQDSDEEEDNDEEFFEREKEEKTAREKEEASEREKKEKKAREKEEARKREKEEKKAREKEEARKREKEEKKAREKEEARKREKEEKKAREKEEAREREKEKRKETRDIAEHAMSMESEDPLAYFRSFSKKPVDFRKLYGPSSSDSGSYSSSTSRTESSDDFPSPDTPIKNKPYKKSENNHEDLFEKVNELQRKLHELEIKNKKLKAKA